MSEADQIEAQARRIMELEVRLAKAEKRVAQQQLILERQNQRIARLQYSARQEAEAVFSGKT